LTKTPAQISVIQETVRKLGQSRVLRKVEILHPFAAKYRQDGQIIIKKRAKETAKMVTNISHWSFLKQQSFLAEIVVTPGPFSIRKQPE